MINPVMSALPLQGSRNVLCAAENGKLEDRILAIIVNTQAGVEESCVFIIKRTGQMAGVIQTVLPIYFDFRISVAQTKPVDKDDKQSIQDSKNDFTLKLFCDQIEASVQTDDLETLQGLLRELRRSHLIAQDDNFYAGGSSHRWVQFYTIDETQNEEASAKDGILSMDEFIASTSNPLSKYFLQPEEIHMGFPYSGTRLDLGLVKESWVEKEMRARESEFTEYDFMHAFVGTWNVNGKNAPEKLDPWLKVEGEVQPDIYVLCFQELDLSAEAYIVLDGSKEEEWTRAIGECLGNGYQKVMSKQLVGLLIVMYAAEAHTKYIKEVTASSAGVGSHLAADTNQLERRNQDYQEICRRLAFPSSGSYDITKSPAVNAAISVGNKMVSIFDCDHTIWAGDLNYRLALPEDQVKGLLRSNDFDTLLKYDQVKTLMHEKQAEVHQAIVRDLDKYENECMPDATLSSSNVVFDEVRYLEPKKASVTIKNTGQFPAQYRFKPKLQDVRFCKPWIWANPPVAMIMPGESAKIHLTVMVDNESAPLLNTGKEKMDDILILHLEHGKDYFISVSGSYIRTCFGNSLEWLSRLDRPIRLWNPDDSDDDEEEDDAATLYDRFGALGTKSSMSSIRDNADGGREIAVEDISKQVRNVKSVDSLPDRDPVGRKMSSMSLATGKPAPIKKQKATRQLSLPKDLWRIVDFIYKHGFSVDNLFLLSGDQSTMSYIRECLDTGEEFDLSRLLDKTPQDAESSTSEKGQESTATSKRGPATVAPEASSLAASSTLSPRGSVSDLKPQIARPVSIMNGIPPKAATFGLGENRGIHSMAEVLLRFLESLREPVVPTEMYYRALEVANHQQAAYGLLDLMPPVHVNVFVYITSFLRELILIGGGYHGSTAATSNSSSNGKDGVAGNNTATNGNVTTNTSRVLQSGSSSVYNGADAGGSGGRGKREDEDYRVAKLAAVFSSVLLRPPPGAERLSEVEALKRKYFLMQFLQEPVEEEGGLLGVPPTSYSATGAAAAGASPASVSAAGMTGQGHSGGTDPEAKDY
ncbi:hypothetical protein BGX21_008329 [Mortierella sp. AD011]|nr:hypothetical protein BGX21_008329 [Mortierella sp. AD011]